ncbi:MAG: hypothetical protein Q9190_008030, partial [Brigantiaea leucoxantha]
MKEKLYQMSKPFDSVLVIGGCGFLGHHIVNQLLQQSAQISVLDLRTNVNRIPGISYYDGDITSTHVKSIISKVQPQVMFHTASPLATTNNAAPLYHKVNVDGTRNLLECASQTASIKAFIFTSSASVVHDGTSNLINATETSHPILYHPQQPEIYSHTKALAEDLVLAANRANGRMLTLALRPAGIFGEGDNQLIPGMMKALEEGKHKFQLGDNSNLFDFTYVGNVAHAHVLAAKKLLEAASSSPDSASPKQKRIDGEPFFITNDEPYPFWTFTHTLWRQAGDRTNPNEIWTISKPL